MNEIEVNEDNCVLDKGEINIMGYILINYGKDLMPTQQQDLEIMFRKIETLNDMAKKELGK